MKDGIQVLLDHLDAPEQLTQSLECVVLALDGDEDLCRGRKSVDREQPQ